MVSKYRSLVKKKKEKSTAVKLKAVPTTSGCLTSSKVMGAGVQSFSLPVKDCP